MIKAWHWLVLHLAAMMLGASLGASLMLLLIKCASAEEPTIPEMFAEIAATEPAAHVGPPMQHPLSDGSPFSMGWMGESKICILLVDADNFDRLESVKPDIPLALRVRTSIAHEFGHCLVKSHVEGVPAMPDNSHENERFADLYALAWTAKYYPDDEAKAYEFLKALRERYSGGSHHAKVGELRVFHEVIDTPQATAIRAMRGEHIEVTL